MSFLNNCRQFTNLSAMKANFLQRINTVLPLVSDLVHAHVAMYTFPKKKIISLLFLNLNHILRIIL